MVIKNKRKAGSANAETPEKKIAIDHYVAPQNGKACRAVVAKWGDREFTDIINPNQAAARDDFVKCLAEDWEIEEPDELRHVKQDIVEKAKEADVLAQQAAQDAAEAAEQADVSSVDSVAKTSLPPWRQHGQGDRENARG